MSGSLDALFRFIVRLFFFVLGALFFVALLAFVLLLWMLWILRTLWARITGKPVTAWAVRMDPMEGWRRTVRRSSAGQRAGANGKPKDPVIIDVDAREATSADKEKPSGS